MALNSSVIANPRQLYQGQPNAPITAPTAPPSLSVGGVGGTLPTGTYYVAYSWTNTTFPSNYNETNFSTIASIGVTVGQVLTATLPALGYNANLAFVYIGATTGQTNMHLQGFTVTSTFNQSVPLNTGTRLSPVTNETLNPIPLYQSPDFSANVTTPSATAYVTEIIACNTATTPATLTMYLSSTALTSNRIISGLVIQPNSTEYLTDLKTYMSALTYLYASQLDAGSLTLTISGVEVQ